VRVCVGSKALTTVPVFRNDEFLLSLSEPQVNKNGRLIGLKCYYGWCSEELG